MTEEFNKVIEVETTNKEFEYRYQPQDELGRNLGSVQVFKGKTVQEVLDKVADANKHLIKLNRELTRKNRLGEFEQDQLPEGTVLVTNNQLLQPKELTVEEKAQFARDILDPEKFDEVNMRLIEAQFGAKPKDIREKINRQEQRLADIEARQEAEYFAASNPDYYICQDNFRMITSWMVKNNLFPRRENFQLAYDTLKGEGLMVPAPVEVRERQREELPSVTLPVEVLPPVPPVLPVPEVPPVRTAPSGLTRDLASDQGTPPRQTTLTKEEVEKMGSVEYKKRLLTDKNFAKAVDALYTKK
jgi:hypothetical protein